MAASVVTFFMEKLSALITQEANLISGVSKQIDSLRNELEWIRSVLKDADDRKFIDNDKAKLWVNQVRSIAYEAEDVIDEFIYKVEHQGLRGTCVGGIIRSSLCTCYGSISQLKLRHDLGNQIETIKKKIEEVSANKSRYGIETLQFGETSTCSQQSLSLVRQIKRATLVEEVDVVGMEDEREMLVKQLIEGEPRLSIPSIVGMGGLGKTTLAKKVYNSNDACRHFDFRAWITVSQEYKIRELLESLLDQIATFKEEQQRKVNKMSDKQLQTELFGKLKEWRYLVVVDDIWKIEDWDTLP
ncbi:hypothetical protein NE237_016147 [Protea cynaroides]|uniref:Disease resistance protein n=1 Tax=Protea cynaroides TaxID=273540 RepID=A0A9Q0KFB8_9MAGN|nr:hypothetical protein NE237_016147 [Protea cynaroides]